MDSDREEKLVEVRRVLEHSLRPPHTPATNLEKRLRSVQSVSIKDKHREAAHRRRFPPIRELKFEDDDRSDSLLSSPLLSAQSSIIFGDFDEDQSEPRYYHDFHELGIIASGDYGEVYRCQHRLDKQHYAIKRLRLNIGTKTARELAMHEALTMAASSFYYDSQHILKYRNMWIEREHLYIAMELCECSLRMFVERNGQLTPVQITQVLRDICKGLRELHSMQTVHLDIKPENILYSFSHIFKLGDLGLSRMLSALTEGAEVPEGDSRYLAPELLNILPAKQDSIPDLTKSDIFSLGATVYEILIGTPLPSHGERWHALRQGQFDFPAGTDAVIQEQVTRMMSADPALRPSAAELLQEVFVSHTRRELKRLRGVVEGLDAKGGGKRRRMSL